MLDGLLSPIESPECLCERRAGAHVGTGLEDAPEVADILLERLGAERAFAGGDALLEELPCFLRARCRFFGEQQVGVGAVG